MARRRRADFVLDVRELSEGQKSCQHQHCAGEQVDDDRVERRMLLGNVLVDVGHDCLSFCPAFGARSTLLSAFEFRGRPRPTGGIWAVNRSFQ